MHNGPGMDREAVPVQRAADGPFTLAFGGAKGADGSSWAMQGTPIATVGKATPCRGYGLLSVGTSGLCGEACLAVQAAVLVGSRLRCSCKRTASRSACSGGGLMCKHQSHVQPRTARIQARQLTPHPPAQPAAAQQLRHIQSKPEVLIKLLCMTRRRHFRK